MGRGLSAFVLFASPVVLSATLMARAAQGGGWKGAWWSFSAAAASFDYGHFGPVRRGLAASLARLIDPEPMAGTAYLSLLALAALCALCGWTWWRLGRSYAVALVLSASLLRLSTDIARVDSLTLLLGASAALAAFAERWILASVLLLAALAVHETGMILFGPLLGAIAFERRSWRRIAPWKAAVAFGLLLGGVALYAVDAAPSGSPVEAAQRVLERFPPSMAADVATYFMVSGLRGVQAAICENTADPSYALRVGLGLAIIAGSIVALRLRPAVAALAIVRGFLLLCVVALDVGRWTYLSTFAVGLFALMSPARETSPQTSWRSALALALAALLIPTGQGQRAYAPSPLVNMFAKAKPPPGLLDRCDPGWRRLIGR